MVTEAVAPTFCAKNASNAFARNLFLVDRLTVICIT